MPLRLQVSLPTEQVGIRTYTNLDFRSYLLLAFKNISVLPESSIFDKM